MAVFYSHAIEKNDGSKIGSKLLKDHLREVGNSVEHLITLIPNNNSKISPRIGYLLGIAHDFGKYTTFFQDYLLRDKKDTSSKHHHGFISAIFAAYLIKKFAETNNTHDKYLPLLAYFIVLHHHGDLNALELDVVRTKDLTEKDFLSVPEPLRSRLKTLVSQLSDIDKNLSHIDADFRLLIQNISLEDFITSWRDTLQNIYMLYYDLTNREKDEIKLLVFVITLFLYSTLIDSDKKDATDISSIKRKEIPGSLVDRYRETSPEIDTKTRIGINGIRNKIYEEALLRISEILLSNHILTLTAPTGTGKTLTSISCALKLRERIKNEKGYTPRIIYSLPFTSIIDQNYEEIKKVLSQLPDFNRDKNSYLIKHHHLADLTYKIEDEERPINESLLLVESWESEVIVTTFIQLLHSLIGFKNSFLKKYHNIAGSIILLDEVQNIPVEYWPIINKVFKLLVEHLGCYVILLTATKPLIFDEKETVNLLEHNEVYFKQMDRVTLLPDVNAMPLNEFFQKFKGLYNKSKSYLIVLNTIKSSIQLYNLLKEDAMFKELVGKKHLFYLSTNVIPKERRERITKIKDGLERKEKIIVISTQVIEAGVDIDLDIVIRDIGPIDSIIQVAGRCNRGMGKSKGKVYVFNLADDRCSYAKYVYGNTHHIVSYNLLNKKNILEESQFFDLINQYFTVITEKKNQDDSKYIWEAVKAFRFRHPTNRESISNFELIKERAGYVDVFVEADAKARELLLKYITDVIKERNFKKRQESYFSMRKDFNSYIISIPKNLSVGLSNINEGLLRIRYEQLDIYYDSDTGFKRTEDASFVF